MEIETVGDALKKAIDEMENHPEKLDPPQGGCKECSWHDGRLFWICEAHYAPALAKACLETTSVLTAAKLIAQNQSARKSRTKSGGRQSVIFEMIN